MSALTESLPGSPSLRRALYALGLVVLFRYFFEFSWAQVVVIAAIVLVSESAEELKDGPKVGPWAFVRDNTRRAVVRLARPFRLFVPS